MKKIGLDQHRRDLLRELDKAATAGPWFSQGGRVIAAVAPLAALDKWDNLPRHYPIGEADAGEMIDPVSATELDWAPEVDLVNARLMAEARTAIPDMLAYIEELEAQLNKY
jgi:hypothetical protein